MNNSRTLTLQNIAVWDTSERIDLIVEGVRQDALIEPNARICGEIDASDCIVAPGFADPHVHFRDPGQTDKETMMTGGNAAAAGGYTQVLIMPNTIPAVDGEPWNDAPFDVENVIDYLQRYGCIYGVKLPVRYDLSVCASGGRSGVDPSNVNLWKKYVPGIEDSQKTSPMKKHPVVAISDDGAAVTDSILQDVLKIAKETGLPLLEHCEHHNSGSVNEGPVAKILGVGGIPASTELAIVKRDIDAARVSGVHVHFQHVSTAAAFEAIRKAKKEGLPITCETAPHYLALCDEDVLKYGVNAKMNPPLRSKADRQATLGAIADGTIDMIATDHAPHTDADKAGDFASAPNGIIGLECAYAVCRKVLVDAGYTDDKHLIELMSVNPMQLMSRRPTDVSALLNVSSKCALRRTLRLSNTEHPENVDLVLINMNEKWSVDSSLFHSKARNTPFDGWQLKGRPVATIIGSQIAFSRMQSRI